MANWQKRKQYRIDARKYHELVKAVKIFAFRVDQVFCICDNAYIQRGLSDPNCQAHEISDWLFGEIETHLTTLANDPASATLQPSGSHEKSSNQPGNSVQNQPGI